MAPMQCDSDDKTGDISSSTRLCGDTDNDSSPTGGEAETLDVNKPGCCSYVPCGRTTSCMQESDSGISCGVIENGHLAELTERMNAMGIAGSDDVSKADTCCVSLGEGCAGGRSDVKVTCVADNLHKAGDATGDDQQKLYRTEVSLYVSRVNNDGESNSEVLRGVSHVSNGYRESDVLEEVSHVNDDGQSNHRVKDLSRVKDEITNNGQSDLDVQDLSQVKDVVESKTEVQDVTRVKADGHCSIEAHDSKETNCSDSKNLVNGIETEQCAKPPHSQCNGRLSPCVSCDKSRNDVGTPSNAAPADARRAEGEKQTNSILGSLPNTKYQKKLDVQLKV